MINAYDRNSRMEVNIMTWKMILDMIVHILMLWVCIDFVKNRFKNLTKTRKMISIPLYLFLAIWAVYRLIIDVIEIIK